MVIKVIVPGIHYLKPVVQYKSPENFFRNVVLKENWRWGLKNLGLLVLSGIVS